jgi:hypothetical protein
MSASQPNQSGGERQVDSAEGQAYQEDLVQTLAEEFLSYTGGSSGGSSSTATPTGQAQTPSPYEE